MSKEDCKLIQDDIDNLFTYLKDYTKMKKTKLVSYQSMNRILFLKSRVEEMKIMMDRSAHNIDLAVEKYATNIDIELNKRTDSLNDIMMVFTIITIIFVPPQLIGGIMGMNVLVPGQETDSYRPFFLILSFSALLSILFFYGAVKFTRPKWQTTY